MNVCKVVQPKELTEFQTLLYFQVQKEELSQFRSVQLTETDHSETTITSTAVTKLMFGKRPNFVETNETEDCIHGTTKSTFSVNDSSLAVYDVMVSRFLF